MGTSTSAFGAGKSEGHDASDFYARFTAPDISTDATVAVQPEVDRIWRGDSRNMDAIVDDSVALVVTSPPYFAGKEYELALGEGHVPASYLDYLQMLEDVFAECVRTLEPGGRIAVNVANLGRKPYRSLSADVITILQDRLRLLMRGEVIWWKGKGASGSCAWGSFKKPSNPVLRDLTERVIIASKGRFDRAVPESKREDVVPVNESGQALLWADDFMDMTTDLWEIPTESARRGDHHSPFPVARRPAVQPAEVSECVAPGRSAHPRPRAGAGNRAPRRRLHRSGLPATQSRRSRRPAHNARPGEARPTR